MAFLGGEESLGMWDSELSLPMVPSPLKGEASAANVGVPRPRAEAHEHEEGLPAVRGARGPGDGSRGEVRQGGGGHKGGRGVVDWSTLKLSKPLSSVGKSTAAMLERSLQAMNVKGSRSKHGGPRTVAVDGAVVSEVRALTEWMRIPLGWM